jgi:hypothetical protein
VWSGGGRASRKGTDRMLLVEMVSIMSMEKESREMLGVPAKLR